MKIVLTNDDGIDAPGLETLRQILAPDGVAIVVVAPRDPQSGVGHRVTTRTPLRVAPVGTGRFSVDGTPADCVRIALKAVACDADWIVAGINPGANLGSDVYNSGTVAAAREAAILGRPAIAISQYIARDQTVDWAVTGRHAQGVLARLLGQPLGRGSYWNVNLPHPLEACQRLAQIVCGLDPHPHRYRFRQDGPDYHYDGTIHERPRQPGADVDVCFGGAVAITRLAVTAEGC